MMKIITVLSMSLLGVASAQSSPVVTMLLPNMNVEPYVGSVIGENAAATTYFVTCGAGTNDNCGNAPGFTAIQGPKTAGYYYSLTASDVLVSYGCSVGGSTTAICSETVTGTGAMSPGVSTFTLGPSDLPFMEIPVTVTAGSITQGMSSATSATTASTTSGGAPSSTTMGSSSTSSNPSTSPTNTSQKSSATSATSTGGIMPVMTGNVKLAVGGAVLAFAAAGI